MELSSPTYVLDRRKRLADIEALPTVTCGVSSRGQVLSAGIFISFGCGVLRSLLGVLQQRRLQNTNIPSALRA
jgi:hypothetical protein